MSADATTCAICGGPFSEERIHIHGKAYHPHCSVMSHGPHTYEDYAALWNKYEQLRTRTNGEPSKLACEVAAAIERETRNGHSGILGIGGLRIPFAEWVQRKLDDATETLQRRKD